MTTIPFPAKQLDEADDDEAAMARRFAAVVAGLLPDHRAQGPAAAALVEVLEELHTALLEFADAPTETAQHILVDMLIRRFLDLRGTPSAP
ncbi:hypothetical protein [Kitasatospora sp. NPDC088783]|uniref:hypothetical protein n=1 Tax=Kitasatospora sp. NPDC088783 TaxID=3364077 RepID=UPI00381CB392